MQNKPHIPLRWLPPFFIMLFVFLLVAPVSASKQEPASPHHHLSNTSLNANIYLTTATLKPLFQDRINQQLPTIVHNAIANLANTLPANSQDWAKQIATTLIQPTATLSQLTPQTGALAATIDLSLYPNDPKPTAANLLITFSVLNPSTIQVSAQPAKGSPTLLSGPLTTIQVPIGQLKTIATTPTCGDAALVLNLQIPASLTSSPTAFSAPNRATILLTTLAARQPGSTLTNPQSLPANNQFLTDIQQHYLSQVASNPILAYVEVPAASLASLASNIDAMPISNFWTAQNFQLTVQDHSLIITSDIVLADTSIKLATATTTVQPAASNGNLVMHVLKTDLTVLIFTFPNNTYQQQIEQMLNSQLSNLLSNKFNVTAASIGTDNHIPCAASNSLILTGTANLE